MDFFLTALSFTILLPNNIPTSTAIRNAPSPSPADAPLTLHIVSHDNTNPAAPSADPNDDEDKKKPSKKGVLGTAINPALRDICEATKIPNKCMDYLAPIATRAGGTYQDPVSILNLEVELLYKKVEKATDDAKDMMAKKKDVVSTSPEVAKGLNACVGLYNKATDDLARALLECSENKNGATVEQMLSSALQSIRSCDAVFGGKSGEKDAPMAEVNEKMIDMAELGMEISGKWLTKGKAQTKIIS
ncbi:unnamed protein product [Linum trigynum]|uniref:Pectinesterase inhibitor domain-containing protein n=2 Tax=Linum trigynum TaxID=586398 RepID=A0AAV2CKC3_9ROSI